MRRCCTFISSAVNCSFSLNVICARSARDSRKARWTAHTQDQLVGWGAGGGQGKVGFPLADPTVLQLYVRMSASSTSMTGRGSATCRPSHSHSGRLARRGPTQDRHGAHAWACLSTHLQGVCIHEHSPHQRRHLLLLLLLLVLVQLSCGRPSWPLPRAP